MSTDFITMENIKVCSDHCRKQVKEIVKAGNKLKDEMSASKDISETNIES